MPRPFRRSLRKSRRRIKLNAGAGPMINVRIPRWKTVKNTVTFNGYPLFINQSFNPHISQRIMTNQHDNQSIPQHTYADTELLRFSTAGSVDDGKSTLIGRLLYDSKSIFEDQYEAVKTASERRGEEG